MRIIADIGGNICNDITKGKKLIDAAIEAGADSVKFQFYRPCDIYATKYHDTKYNIDPATITALFEYAEEADIHSFSSVFHPDGIKFLLDHVGCTDFKIAAFEANRSDLLNCLLENKKHITEVHLSTGLLTVKEILTVFGMFKGRENPFLTPYHSVSNYSGYIKSFDSGMGMVKNLKGLLHKSPDGFHGEVGFSDHHYLNYLSVLAVAMGADCIEKHLRLGDDCPEKYFALLPKEFAIFCKEIRMAAVAVKSEKTSNQQSELKSQIFAIADINKGDELTSKNIRIFRGETVCEEATTPLKFLDIIGTKAQCQYKTGDVIKEALHDRN